MILSDKIIMSDEPARMMPYLRLIELWEKRARRKWMDAINEDDPMGRRLIEHGAIIYQNCARELKEVLDDHDHPTQ